MKGAEVAITIKSIDGAVLYVAESAADVRAALVEAVGKGANLSGAYLYRANLSGANLSWADLSRANGIDPRRHNALLMLLDQPGAIRAYKLVADDYGSPIQSVNRLFYPTGAVLEVPNANTNPDRDCAAGISVATLPWVMREWTPKRRIMLVEFTAADIAAIPQGDGKFRVRKCTVIKELDLVELGLVEAQR